MIEQQQAPRIGIIYDAGGVSSIALCGKFYTPDQLEAIVSAHEAIMAPITSEEHAEGVMAVARMEARRQIARAAIAWAWVYAASGDDRKKAMCLCNAVGAFLAAGGTEAIG
jgi:hypothetical protein